MKDEGGAVFLAVAVVAGILAYNGFFYQTGRQWFDTCWTAQNAGRKPATPEEAIAWSQCGQTAANDFYDAGFIYSDIGPVEGSPQHKALSAACPSAVRDVPMGGIHALLVEMMQSDGGPGLMDKFLPANSYINRTLRKRWPNCSSVRQANGFPKITSRSGSFDWESKCIPCEPPRIAPTSAPQ